VFVQASDLGVEGGVLADAIEANPILLERLDSIRRQAGVAMGIAKDKSSVPGSIPKIGMVSRPHAHRLLSGAELLEKDADVLVRALSVGQPHKAVPITVALALAVASKVEDSIVRRNTSRAAVDSDGVTIGHNSGKILVAPKFDEQGNVEAVTVFRTARRLMAGETFWK
jgi:2-methylaconitate cis-trans-isomerase PrpF